MARLRYCPITCKRRTEQDADHSHAQRRADLLDGRYHARCHAGLGFIDKAQHQIQQRRRDEALARADHDQHGNQPHGHQPAPAIRTCAISSPMETA
ncbi:hypothetical protein M8494_23125 [Serratia ureilytica]